MFLLWSVVPILWITAPVIQDTSPGGSARSLFLFKPTLESYSRLWLDPAPETSPLLVLGLMTVVVLVLLESFAERTDHPEKHRLRRNLGAVIMIIWGIPKIVDTAKFYDYFVNSLNRERRGGRRLGQHWLSFRLRAGALLRDVWCRTFAHGARFSSPSQMAFCFHSIGWAGKVDCTTPTSW